MRADNDPGPEPTLFSATIAPHRSLGRTGFLLVMGLLAGLSFVGGIVFIIIGAWPVVGFLGLDVMLVYWAFRANYRAAAAYEQLTVTASELHLRKVSHRGRAEEWALNPLWTRIEREMHAEFGVLQIFLVSRGWRLAVASFLGPRERKAFANELSAALNEAKRGPRRGVVT